VKDKKNSVRAVYKSLVNSMVGYEVNGNPEQRRFTLLNIASYIVKKIKSKEKPQ